MLNILCLKYGDKYSPDYVNKLYNMVQRHLTVPHRFICFTEDSTGINPAIEIFPLPAINDIKGWWWKTYLFKADHFPAGQTNLFFDLDIVLVNNIDNLLDFMPGHFVGLQDPNKIFQRPIKLNSSVMRWQSGHYGDLWTAIESDRKSIRGLHGDQDWIWQKYHSQIKFFPAKWIKSYKWEVRTHNELIRAGTQQRFATIRNPELDPETSILVFHGTPNPADVQDQIIVDNWK